MDKEKRISDLIDEAASEICDGYCKYPQLYSEKYGPNSDKLIDEICINCPLVNLELEGCK